MLRKLGKWAFKRTRLEDDMFDFYMRLQDAYKYRKWPWGPYRVSIERLNIVAFRVFQIGVSR